MRRAVGRSVGGLVLVLLAIGVVFIVGMRKKSPPVLGVVRRLNRCLTNPLQMKSAGTPGAYASVVRHRGRQTGSTYETPVKAEPTDDGFVIAMPYDTQSDWVKNVLASGTATIVDQGTTYLVDRPEVVPMYDVAEWFPPKDRRHFDQFRVDRALRLRRVDTVRPGEEVARSA